MIVRRQALNAALAVTTADDTRYFLNAIQLDPAKHAARATDGRVAIVVTDSEPHEDEDFPLIPGAEFNDDPPMPFCLPADLARSMIATIPKRSTLPILETIRCAQNGSPTTIVVAATDLQAPRVATIDTAESDAPRFPVLDRVLPAADREEINLCLSVEVLETLIKATKAINAGKSKHALHVIRFGVPSKHTDVIECVRITIKGEDGLAIDGAAMPCRI